MASAAAPAETTTVSPGAALEAVTGMPAAVFDALTPAAQGAVVARIVPERLRSLDQAGSDAVLAVAQPAANVLAAMQDLALAAGVRCEELDLSDLDGGWSDGSEHRPSSVKIVASSVAPLLRLTPRSAESRVADALCLVDELPRTRSMTLEGLLDCRQSRVIVDVAQLVQVGARALFDAAITSVPGLAELTPGRLRRLCERTAALIDAGSMEQRAQPGVDDRFVRVSPGADPGMAWWTASLPSYVSVQAWAAIDELAHEYVRADPGRSIDHARADAFADLLLGSAQVTTVVELVVPTFTDTEGTGVSAVPGCEPDGQSSGCQPATGSAQAPPEPAPETNVLHGHAAGEREKAGRDSDGMDDVTIQRYGLEHVVGPDLAAWQAIGSELAPRGNPAGVRDPRAGWVLSSTLVGILTDPDVRLRVTRADGLTGVTVAREPSVYRPNAALARRVRDRDRTCRFPWCSVTARRCDLDHVVRYPDGTTTEDNLRCLCRTHHGFKHHAGWLLVMDPHGVCVWTAPTGRTHETFPADVRAGAA